MESADAVWQTKLLQSARMMAQCRMPYSGPVPYNLYLQRVSQVRSCQRFMSQVPLSTSHSCLKIAPTASDWDGLGRRAADAVLKNRGTLSPASATLAILQTKDTCLIRFEKPSVYVAAVLQRLQVTVIIQAQRVEVRPAAACAGLRLLLGHGQRCCISTRQRGAPACQRLV